MERPCTRCHERLRLPGQRWCRACLTVSQRDRRRARRSALASERAPRDGFSRQPESATERAVIPPSEIILERRPGGCRDRPRLARPGPCGRLGRAWRCFVLLSRRPLVAPEPRSALLEGASEAARTPYGPAPADAMTKALDRYRCAKAELDRVTRQTAWRRSCYSPGAVLAPLVSAVTRARAECQALGLTPDRAVTHAVAADSCCPGATLSTR